MREGTQMIPLDPGVVGKAEPDSRNLRHLSATADSTGADYQLRSGPDHFVVLHQNIGRRPRYLPADAHAADKDDPLVAQDVPSGLEEVRVGIERGAHNLEVGVADHDAVIPSLGLDTLEAILEANVVNDPVVGAGLVGRRIFHERNPYQRVGLDKVEGHAEVLQREITNCNRRNPGAIDQAEVGSRRVLKPIA